MKTLILSLLFFPMLTSAVNFKLKLRCSGFRTAYLIETGKQEIQLEIPRESYRETFRENSSNIESLIDLKGNMTFFEGFDEEGNGIHISTGLIPTWYNPYKYKKRTQIRYEDHGIEKNLNDCRILD